jgi:hypothetical protein
MYDINEAFSRLTSTLYNIVFNGSENRQVRPTIEQIEDIKFNLDNIFSDNKCIDFLYTYNTDKPFFGVKVYPIISQADAITILTSEDKVKFNKYKVEVDSKLFESLDFEPTEVAAYIIYEISSIANSYSIVDKFRGLLDDYMVNNNDVLLIRTSVNYAQMIIFAIKDTLGKLSSIIYNDPEMFINDQTIQVLNLKEVILSVHEKINGKLISTGEDRPSQKAYILQYILMMYRNMADNSSAIFETLKDAKLCTGSQLETDEINKTINAINIIDNLIPTTKSIDLNESTNNYVPLHKIFEQYNLHSINELSLFKNLRKNGLRSIEDSYYEYAMMIKNVETEEDALYIMRGIATRLNILEDYINNTPDLPEYERKKWMELAMKYRALRVNLMKQKIWKKANYGLFFDYNQLPND